VAVVFFPVAGVVAGDGLTLGTGPLVPGAGKPRPGFCTGFSAVGDGGTIIAGETNGGAGDALGAAVPVVGFAICSAGLACQPAPTGSPDEGPGCPTPACLFGAGFTGPKLFVGLGNASVLCDVLVPIWGEGEGSLATGVAASWLLVSVAVLSLPAAIVAGKGLCTIPVGETPGEADGLGDVEPAKSGEIIVEMSIHSMKSDLQAFSSKRMRLR